VKVVPWTVPAGRSDENLLRCIAILRDKPERTQIRLGLPGLVAEAERRGLPVNDEAPAVQGEGSDQQTTESRKDNR